jgi:hypothetical protein
VENNVIFDQICLKLRGEAREKGYGGLDLANKNSSCIKPTTFPPTVSTTSQLRDSHEQRLFGRLFDSSASTSILTAEREHFFFMRLRHEWQVTLFRTKDRLHWINAGSCPGTWSVAKRGKNELSPPFRTVSKGIPSF